MHISINWCYLPLRQETLQSKGMLIKQKIREVSKIGNTITEESHTIVFNLYTLYCTSQNCDYHIYVFKILPFISYNRLSSKNLLNLFWGVKPFEPVIFV